MITRLLAAVAAVALLLTLLINGPFGIDEGTYRKIYGALQGFAPKAAPARDAEQQNNLPDIEAMAACLIGQAAVSLHGQRSTDHDAEKAAEIALRQAMIVCRHGLEATDVEFVVGAIEALANHLGFEDPPPGDHDERLPWFFRGNWCRIQQDGDGLTLEPLRADRECSSRLTITATEISGEILTEAGERFSACSVEHSDGNKNLWYRTDLTCDDRSFLTTVMWSDDGLYIRSLSPLP
jgi:hypothetical protein